MVVDARKHTCGAKTLVLDQQGCNTKRDFPKIFELWIVTSVQLRKDRYVEIAPASYFSLALWAAEPGDFDSDRPTESGALQASNTVRAIRAMSLSNRGIV